MSCVDSDSDVCHLFACYNIVLRDIADRVAPQHSLRRRAGCLAPWFDANCHAERQYRRTCSPVDRCVWVSETRRQFQLYCQKKEDYWQQHFELCSRSSQKIWRKMTTLVGRDCSISCATGHTADGFTAFFAHKIDGVRSDTAVLPPPPVLTPATSLIASFRPCTQAEIRKIIMSAPMKSSSLDHVPIFLVHELIDVLLPHITLMVTCPRSTAGFSEMC